MSVADQVMAIFAGTKGFLDAIPVEQVLKFRDGFLQFVDSAYPEIAKAIIDEKLISEDTDAKLRKALDEFVAQFSA